MDVLLGTAVFIMACLFAWWFGDRERLSSALRFIGLGRGSCERKGQAEPDNYCNAHEQTLQ